MSIRALIRPPPPPWRRLSLSLSLSGIARSSPMASSRPMLSPGITHRTDPHHPWKQHLHTRMASVVGTASIPTKCCMDHHDGILRRARADEERRSSEARAALVRVSPRLFRDSEAILREEEAKSLNGHGRPLDFLHTPPAPHKLAVAVDVDEVLGSFLSALNKFIADRYSLNHSLSEYYVYEFFKIWNCSRAEADILVHEFFKTSYFKTGIHPIPGARHTLHKLSAFCKLSVVTSRQNVIKDHTLEWIEQHYPGLFRDIHFGNHFALDGQSRPKSEICRSLGAQVLVDDNPRYAIECADVGIRVLLFDYDNSYPWCKTVAATSHPLVTKVHNWQEVEQHLVSWSMV